MFKMDNPIVKIINVLINIAKSINIVLDNISLPTKEY